MAVVHWLDGCRYWHSAGRAEHCAAAGRLTSEPACDRRSGPGIAVTSIRRCRSTLDALAEAIRGRGGAIRRGAPRPGEARRRSPRRSAGRPGRLTRRSRTQVALRPWSRRRSARSPSPRAAPARTAPPGSAGRGHRRRRSRWQPRRVKRGRSDVLRGGPRGPVAKDHRRRKRGFPDPDVRKPRPSEGRSFARRAAQRRDRTAPLPASRAVLGPPSRRVHRSGPGRRRCRSPRSGLPGREASGPARDVGSRRRRQPCSPVPRRAPSASARP